MSDSSVRSALNKVSNITRLKGTDDWVEWNRNLRGHLGMLGLWRTHIGESPALVTELGENIVWQANRHGHNHKKSFNYSKGLSRFIYAGNAA